MNVYEVMSEPLEFGGNLYGWEPEPPEYSCIVELVVARSHSQAKWMAWKANNGGLSGGINEMPKFLVLIVGRDADGECRLVTNEPGYQDLWGAYMGGPPTVQCAKCGKFMSRKSGTAVVRRVSGYQDPEGQMYLIEGEDRR